MSGIDRRTLSILLAALELEQQELAGLMGYDSGYVRNVLGGCANASSGFRDAFGRALADLLLGEPRRGEKLPAAPLAGFLRNRASQAPSKEQFYSDLGLNHRGWNKRRFVGEALVDRICCDLGIHPSSLYGPDVSGEQAS